MNMIQKMQDMNKAKRNELIASGFSFSPVVDFNDLSIDEMNDMMELEIDESTYIIGTGDVKRIS